MYLTEIVGFFFFRAYFKDILLVFYVISLCCFLPQHLYLENGLNFKKERFSPFCFSFEYVCLVLCHQIFGIFNFIPQIFYTA